MKTNEGECTRRLLIHEGGNDDDPRDPGGRTSRGILQSEWNVYRKTRAGLPTDVWQAPQADVLNIYDSLYWDALRSDDVPMGVDYAVFDYGVNSGIGRSGKVLRRVLGLPDSDWHVTDDVLKALDKRDAKVVASAICDERLVFLKGLKTWSAYGRGWSSRVSEVRAASLVMAGSVQSVKPNINVVAVAGSPPWFDRMSAIMGLYEFPGSKDNPAIIAMAKTCGGEIARTYLHDLIAWCALTVNWCLKTAGQPLDGTLWALDFRQYGRKLDGPCVGAIATKTRDGGGHVFLVVGRTADGRIVGRGGNQSDMVCDETFDPAVLKYNWPSGYPLPETPTFARLPIVSPAPKVHRDFASLPQPTTVVDGGKGTIVTPQIITPKTSTGGGAVAVGAGATWHDWIGAHPWETAAIGIGAGVVIGAGIFAARRLHKAKQEAATPGVVPVAA